MPLGLKVVRTLKDQIATGRVAEVWETLSKAYNGQIPNDFISLKADFRAYQDELQKGTIHPLLIDHKRAELNTRLMGLIDFFASQEGNDEQQHKRPKFNICHQYTCDRTEQVRIFEPLLDEAACARIHCFYLHGGEAHRHESLFRRFVHRTIGEDKPTGYEVVDISISDIDQDTDLSRLSLECSKAILRELETEEHLWPKLPERSLAWGIENGARTRKLGTNGKILFHLSITEALWDSVVTPEQTASLIQNFCKKEPLRPDGPEVFIFFSIEYDNGNERIKDEIQAAMQAAEFVRSMGELKLVTAADIKNWFLKYRKMWDDEEERVAAQEFHFGNETSGMYMKKVLRTLKKVIEEVNNDIKHEPRN